MSAKMESKQHTRSVIAKLMGLDDLPPQQPVQKRQRVLSENYLRRVASIGVIEKRPFYERHSFRLSLEEQKEFKDVFEVSETLKMGKGKADSSPSDAKMEYVSQDFINAKCISMDMKLQTSKEFHHALGVIDSERDHFLKYLQEPDSLLAKHLHDLQGVPTQPHSSRITVSKSISASDYRKSDICKKPGRRRNQRNAKSLQKVENGLITDSRGEFGLDNIRNFSRSRLESNDEACFPYTKIVVLQPNHGKLENAARCFSSSSSREASPSGKHKEFLLPENGNIYVEVKERKNLSNEVEPVGLTIPSSPDISDWKNKYKSSFYHSDGSYMAREAKKKILEIWKTTKKFQEVGLAGRGRNLGEMLAMPDHESRRRILDYKRGEHGLNNLICPDDGDMNFRTPLHISSRDGWKDEGFRYLPTSKSVPGYSTAIGSPRTRINHKVPHNDRYMGPLQHMLRKQVPNQRDGLQSRNSGSSCMKSQSIPSVDNDEVIENELKRKLEEKNPYEQNSMVSKSSSYSGFGSGSLHNCTIPESWVLPHEQVNNVKERDLSEQNSVFPVSSVSSVAAVSMVAEGVADSETEVVGRYSGNHKDQQFEPADCILLVKDDDASQIQDNLTQQDISTGISEEGSVSSFCSGTDPESFMNLEEAYQPSPVSVLEPLFKEEISSGAEFFCRVNADLHGLRQRLEFLKSDPSEAYSEGSGMIVSSDEETEEGSEGNSEENEDIMRSFKVEESRDFSYIVDVLHEAGFHGRNPDMGFNTWPSPECAINHSVFEKVEKKYGEQMSWKRSERRLLFDRINLGLMDIFQPYIGTPAFAKPVLRRLSFRQSLEEELWMLLVSLEKEVSKYSSDQKVLGKDDRWLELGDDIEVIGREIESSLIDELAAEVVSMQSI